jgi:uncharacterized protein YkvS
LKKAQVNDKIRSKNGIIGIVRNVYDSSVIIKILINPTGLFYENNVTVVNHKNYEIVQKAPIQNLF